MITNFEGHKLELYTTREVAELFGMHIKSVHKYVKNKKLETVPTPGRALRFEKYYIDRLFEAINNKT